ncbi:MAG: GatB/YqeY domain-containing protein [Parcubacteria group bacterium]|nr:GatB/YqeY domain-containing protein [Parcubacteria group bacterium]
MPMEDRTKGNTLQDRIDDDYKTAFKAKNEQVYIPLRPVLSALKQAAIDRRHELNNEEITELLKSEVKKRKDALEQFTAGNRQDLIEQTNREISLISVYLPAQMADADLEAIVKATIAETGATDATKSGQLVGAVMKKVKGQADGGRVKAFVESLLK